MSLQDFARKVLTLSIGDLRPVAYYNIGYITTIILLREPPFQAELLQIHSTTPAPLVEHRHPDVDGIEFELYGHIPLTVNGALALDSVETCAFRSTTVTHDDWHGAEANITTGSMFLSCQEWLNNVLPSSVLLNWQGIPVSKEHWAMLHHHIEAKWVRAHKNRHK